MDLRSGPRTAETLLHRVIGAEVDAHLRLPREEWTVAVARRLAGSILNAASQDVRQAVQIAITEACSNAVMHADPAKDYRLHIRMRGGRCEVQVIDAGAGFDIAAVPTSPGSTATSGRGLMMIRALVDQFDLRSGRPTGTVLMFSKRTY